MAFILLIPLSTVQAQNDESEQPPDDLPNPNEFKPAPPIEIPVPDFEWESGYAPTEEEKEEMREKVRELIREIERQQMMIFILEFIILVLLVIIFIMLIIWWKAFGPLIKKNNN